MLELPYGRVPYPLDLGAREHRVLGPPAPPARVPELRDLLDGALAQPIGRPPLHEMISPKTRVTLIVSDATRDEPRAAFVDAVLRHLRTDVRLTLAIATGTHGPANLDDLGLDARVLARATLVNHDGHSPADLVDLGTTLRGTPVRVHRCLVDADLVVATGCIRPHYFAGFGAGVKAMFPGLGEAAAIRTNHALKTQPGARAGNVDDNPCRLDLEDAVARIPTPTFLLDGVCASDGRVHAAVAGDPVTAFRAGVELARPWFTVRAAPASIVIASDVPPITSTLYQAAKIAAAAAPLVARDGLLVLVAACEDGSGPLDVVNEAIFRTGILPRLREGVRIELVSTLTPDIVARTLVHHTSSIANSLARAPATPILILPRASQLICEADRVY
ncbi:MAG: DUF2088 domain-containing protein [Deltaproteobacteria bacterium]|nr:DUF2088 domain-containing protein [Deltaproteobacteria bacterium]